MIFYHTEILLIFILSGLLLAQKEDSTLVVSDQIIESLVPEPVINYEEFNVIDYLEDLQKNPININTADLIILQKIPELDINYAQRRVFKPRRAAASRRLSPSLNRPARNCITPPRHRARCNPGANIFWRKPAIS